MGKGASSVAPRHGSPIGEGRRRPLFKTWLVGVAIIIADIAGAVLLVQAGYDVTAMVWTVLCALAMLVGALESLAVGFVGILIACAAGIVASGEDAPIFGGSARDVQVASAPGVSATFFHFRDGRVLADMAEPIDILGGTQRQGTHLLYTLYVAPVVGADWTPAQPVTVFAVTGHPGNDQGRSQWARPWRAGIRLGGLNSAEIRGGIEEIAHRSGIIAAADAVRVRWTADPEGEAAAARIRLITIASIAALFWAGVLISGRIVGARRRR